MANSKKPAPRPASPKAKPPRAPKRSYTLAVWSLFVTVLILVLMTTPYMSRW